MAEAAQPVHADVWLWTLDVSADERARLAGLLSSEEQARAGRFHRAIARDRWSVARGRMRELLGAATGRDPAGLVFQEHLYGRPYLADAPMAPSFNLSHSGAVGALAICLDAAVGVDVETIREMDAAGIAFSLSDAERAQLAAMGGRLEDFFRFWTLKESLMKGLGLGAGLPLQDFDIDLAGLRLSRLGEDPDEAPFWAFAETEPAPGVRAAVAVRAGGRPLNVTWRPLDNLG